MQILYNIFNTILDAGAVVMLPIIITIIGLIFRVKLSKAFRSGLTIGIGFAGINLVINMMKSNLLSDILGVNIEKILLGDLEPNKKDGGNMKRIKFYVCPVCGNVISSTGMAEISCCGRKLNALKARPADLSHSVSAKAVEGDYYITLEHDMEKQHYITFMAYAVYDRVLLMQLYPEQAAQVRFPRSGHGVLYICCNSHGLFSVSL